MEDRYVLSTQGCVHEEGYECVTLDEIIESSGNVKAFADSIEKSMCDTLKGIDRNRQPLLYSFVFDVDPLFNEEYIKSLKNENRDIIQDPDVVKKAILPEYYCVSITYNNDKPTLRGIVRLNDLVDEMRKRGYAAGINLKNNISSLEEVTDIISEGVIHFSNNFIMWSSPVSVIIHVFNNVIKKLNHYDFEKQGMAYGSSRTKNSGKRRVLVNNQEENK